MKLSDLEDDAPVKESKALRLSDLEDADTQAAQAVEQKPLSWSDVPGQAVSNIPKSGGEFVANIWNAISHPIDTAQNIYNLGSGVARHLGYPSRGGVSAEQDKQNKEMATAMGAFLADRYGGMENIKKTIATDPVGFLADASTVLTGGGALAARAPGVVGQAGKAISAVGKAVDPINIAVKTAKPVLSTAGKLSAELIGGLGTHTGAEGIKTAAKAGYSGGKAAEDFQSALRGTSNADDVVTDMKSALSSIRTDRGSAYKAGMAGVKADTTVLDFNPIDKSVTDIFDIGTYKGKVVARSTGETLKKITEIVDEWRGSNPADFHTPEGMDALKRAIGDIRDSTEYGSQSRLMAGKVYSAVKSQIVKQAPEYAKTMKGYEQASDLIKEIEKSLSLGEKSSADTALRKLQSVMRNNVNTNYGKRIELVEKLKEAGAGTIMEKLAGQSLNSISPRGVGKIVAGGVAGAGLYALNPAAIPALALTSPRLVGEAAYYGGRVAGGGRNAISALPPGSSNIAFQAGRVNEEKQKNSLRNR